MDTVTSGLLDIYQQLLGKPFDEVGHSCCWLQA